MKNDQNEMKKQLESLNKNELLLLKELLDYWEHKNGGPIDGLTFSQLVTEFTNEVGNNIINEYNDSDRTLRKTAK